MPVTNLTVWTGLPAGKSMSCMCRSPVWLWPLIEQEWSRTHSLLAISATFYRCAWSRTITYRGILNFGPDGHMRDQCGVVGVVCQLAHQCPTCAGLKFDSDLSSNKSGVEPTASRLYQPPSTTALPAKRNSNFLQVSQDLFFPFSCRPPKAIEKSYKIFDSKVSCFSPPLWSSVMMQ